jgi:hypothetical protein
MFRLLYCRLTKCPLHFTDLHGYFSPMFVQGIRSRFVFTADLSQGLLAPTFLLQPVHHIARHLCHPCLLVSLSQAPPAHQHPIFACWRQSLAEAPKRPLTTIEDQRDQPSTKDPKVSGLFAPKKRLALGQDVVYVGRDACETPHVSGSCAFW